MKKYFTLLFAVLLLITACKFHHYKSPYKGFVTNDGITFFKYCDMDTISRKPLVGCVVELYLSYSKMNDSAFWSSHEGGYPYSLFLSYSKLLNGSTYERSLAEIHKGDSLIYIVPADSIFKDILQKPLPYFLHAGDMVKVHVRMTDIMDSANYLTRIKAIKEYKKDMDLQEQLTLLRYVTANHISDSMKYENVYVVPIEKGEGPKVDKGTMVSLAYRGSFLGGRAFDSVSVNNPLQFRYGDTAQIIPGLEIALKTMQQGEKAKIIIPSQLAFGNNGSSTGIVPPYTTVVYEVTLLKVKAL